MALTETYHFHPSDFNDEGFHKEKEDYLFLDIIRESEQDFHLKHKPYFANSFSAGPKTLHLLKMCFADGDNEILGMESEDGEVDVEMNLEIEKHSDNVTVYAIERFNGDGEPLFLIVDGGYSDRVFMLKYSPDDDSQGISEDLPDPESKLKQPATVPQ